MSRSDADAERRLRDMPRGRRVLLAFLAMMVPLLLLLALEGGLRLWWEGGRYPAFDRFAAGGREYLLPGRRLSRRYFATESLPPQPPADLFAIEKPRRALRIFVMGESSAAGFPYQQNGTFSQVIRDALHDVLPNDSVEVVNVAIAATNSYTIADLSRDVLAQHPDAVLIYAGHNEYYGALGVGSSIRPVSSPALVRLSLAALRLRVGALTRQSIVRVSAASRRGAPADSAVATLMETVARDKEIALGGPVYAAGLKQFRDNLQFAVRRFRDAGVPVYIGSIASNVRDQAPFASPANGPARAAFDSARQSLGAGDSVRARTYFEKARDLDVIRFRAPTSLNDSIRAVARAAGATYVPVAERIAASSPGGMPGRELFLEHVHLNGHGYALVAQVFTEALRRDGWLEHHATGHLAPWSSYEERMALTGFDERIVAHTVRSVTSRWPFVESGKAYDYRGTYRPVSLEDSLALLVSRGGVAWADAKVQVARMREARGELDSAISEYRGLVRAFPLGEPGWREIGRLLVRNGRSSEAVPYLERALALGPTPQACYDLGMIALAAKDYPRAIVFLDSAVTLAPQSVGSLYQLSIAFGLSRNLAPARAAAERAARLDPRYPGLAQWRVTLGLRP